MNTCENVFDLNARMTALDERYTSVSKQFSRSFSSLYAFLGDIHALVIEIGSDGGRVQSLNETLASTESVTETERKRAKSVTAKVVLCVFSKNECDLSNRSTRSNYKRAIQKAVDESLTTAEFVRRLEDGGIVSYLANGKTSDDANKTDLVAEKRKELVANTLPSISSIGLIDNKNPEDTFAVVIYRVDGGQLVPCLATDKTQVVNKLLSTWIPIEQAQIEKEAAAYAEEARLRYINEKKAA